MFASNRHFPYKGEPTEQVMSKYPSIRDQLERDAWRQHPHFAQRRADLRPPQSRPRLGWQDRALLVLAALLVLLLIVRVETARAQADPNQFWGIESAAPGGSRSVALDTDIEVQVNGLSARIRVSQRFRNDGAEWKEAIYRFPLPAGAAVDRLRIAASGRVIDGEIQEKAEARRQYQQARSEGRLASMVEQQRPNQFETRLANIGPGQEVQVEIGYLATVDYRAGSFSLQMPLTFTPRWEPAAPGTDYPNAPRPQLSTASDGHDRHLALEVMLHSLQEIVSIESRYHDIDILPVAGGYQINLANPDVRADRLFQLSWTPAFGTAPEASLSSWDGGDAIYALLMLSPPLAEAIAPRPREVVFVIDTSGSMEGASIRQARAALHQGLDHLGPADRFNLVRFDSDAQLLFPESAAPTATFMADATRFIDKLSAGGGTNMAPALDLALGLPPQPGLVRQVVFVTDGSVGNERELLLEIGDKLGDSRLFTVAIGSAPNTWFMRKAAEIGRGMFTHVGRLDEVGQRMRELWTRIENPAVQNLCVDWGMEAEYYPEIIPDLYTGEPLWLFARLPFEPREVTLCGDLDGRPWETVSRISPLPGGEDLATLWARRKVEALEDSRIFGIDPDTVRREVLDLALGFGLLTPYTSLVAVDRTPQRPAAAELAAEAVPSLLPAGGVTVSGFTQTATGWPARLGLAVISLLIATGMLLYLPPSRASYAGGARQPDPPFSP
jgi:Ca-activated chloride channel family protein